MVLDSLGDSLQDALDPLRNTSGTLTEEDIDPVIKQIQRSLLQGDVDVSIVQEITDNIEERALGETPAGGVTAREHVLNIVYEELLELVGESATVPLEEQTILLAGLQGAGKTTTAAKMAWWFSKKGLKPAVVQTDTFRPGAHEQAQQLAEEGEYNAYTNAEGDDPTEIAETGVDETSSADVQIVDTAGRHASEKELINEIEDIADTIQPDRTFLVIDAAMGNTAKEQARQFEESLGIDGVIITKMDGTAKGGGALAAVKEADAEIAFLGTGENVEDIERFDPSGFISRLLGMGDLQQLSERVERAMHEQEDEDWDPESVFEGEFTMYDMKKQMETMNNMGALDEVMDMLPGLGGNIKSKLDDGMLDMQEERMREFQIIIESFTEEELENPNIIGKSRKERIARGSGSDIEQVNELLSQYNQMKKMADKMGGEQDMKKMAQKLQGMQGGGGGLF